MLNSKTIWSKSKEQDPFGSYKQESFLIVGFIDCQKWPGDQKMPRLYICKLTDVLSLRTHTNKERTFKTTT